MLYSEEIKVMMMTMMNIPEFCCEFSHLTRRHAYKLCKPRCDCNVTIEFLRQQSLMHGIVHTHFCQFYYIVYLLLEG